MSCYFAWNMFYSYLIIDGEEATLIFSPRQGPLRTEHTLCNGLLEANDDGACMQNMSIGPACLYRMKIL